MENSGNMKKELDKVYSPTEIEDKWYKNMGRKMDTLVHSIMMRSQVTQ